MTAKSLAMMATDAHTLMHEAERNVKAHAGIRNEALYKLAHEHRMTSTEIESLTGIPAAVVLNALTRLAKRKANRT